MYELLFACVNDSLPKLPAELKKLLFYEFLSYTDQITHPRGNGTMEQRKEIQKVHYDHLTRNCEPSERYGARISMPAYRAPFDFIENFFLSQEEMKGKKVLDYGCGTGYFSIFLAKLGAQVTGLDISPNSISVAKDCALFHNVQSNCQFLEGDCEDLPFPNESFDYLISVGNLSCLDLDRALKQITRVMKVGGGGG